MPDNFTNICSLEHTEAHFKLDKSCPVCAEREKFEIYRSAVKDLHIEKNEKRKIELAREHKYLQSLFIINEDLLKHNNGAVKLKRKNTNLVIQSSDEEMEKIKYLQEKGWKLHDFLWTRHDSKPDENGIKFCVPTEEALKYVFMSKERK